MKLKNLETIGEPRRSGSFYPNFQSIPLNVSYDADAYRSFVQEIRDVRNSLNTLPPNVREQVRGMLQKVVQVTLDAQKVIYDSLIDPEKIHDVIGDYRTDMVSLDKLPNEFRR